MLPLSAWLHASPHFASFSNPQFNLPPEPFQCVTNTLLKPDRVLDNGQRRGAPLRVAQEQYVRLDGYTGEQVIVPVKIILVRSLKHGLWLDAGTRVAHTFYTGQPSPKDPQLWP